MSITNAQFPQTPAGYRTAVRWLKKNDLYQQVQGEPSVDGYTVVALANSLKARVAPVRDLNSIAL